MPSSQKPTSKPKSKKFLSVPPSESSSDGDYQEDSSSCGSERPKPILGKVLPAIGSLHATTPLSFIQPAIGAVGTNVFLVNTPYEITAPTPLSGSCLQNMFTAPVNGGGSALFYGYQPPAWGCGGWQYNGCKKPKYPVLCPQSFHVEFTVDVAATAGVSGNVYGHPAGGAGPVAYQGYTAAALYPGQLVTASLAVNGSIVGGSTTVTSGVPYGDVAYGATGPSGATGLQPGSVATTAFYLSGSGIVSLCCGDRVSVVLTFGTLPAFVNGVTTAGIPTYAAGNVTVPVSCINALHIDAFSIGECKSSIPTFPPSSYPSRPPCGCN